MPNHATAQRVFPIRLPFCLPINAEKSVQRFVHVYLVRGEQCCLVDTGARSASRVLADQLAALGTNPAEISWVVNSHEHPDHVGGNGFLQEVAHPRFACHAQAARWIEDLDLQFAERPIYGFHSLAGTAVAMSRLLEDGDGIDLGGTTLQVVFTPGHSPGSMSLFCPEDGTLITADAIPPVGGLPLYMDVEKMRHSLQRLAALPGVQTLYCAHADQPFHGAEVAGVIQDGLDYLDRVEVIVTRVVDELPPQAGPEEITRAALQQLGLAPPPVMPITMASIMAHLPRR